MYLLAECCGIKMMNIWCNMDKIWQSRVQNGILNYKINANFEHFTYIYCCVPRMATAKCMCIFLKSFFQTLCHFLAPLSWKYRKLLARSFAYAVIIHYLNILCLWAENASVVVVRVIFVLVIQWCWCNLWCSPVKADFIRAKYQFLAFVNKHKDAEITLEDINKVCEFILMQSRFIC